MPIVAMIRERASGERRIALTPETAKKLKAKDLAVLIESGAGQSAGFDDADYGEDCVSRDLSAVLAQADVLACVQAPSVELLSQLKPGAILIGALAPHQSEARMPVYLSRKISAFALEKLPRTTRAQAMDILSSQAGMAGYKAVLIAAQLAPRFFPMLTTAAGTIRPSKVLIIGAGVAGLQAIATAKRLGAQVEGFDVRPETREQIESLGGKFLDLGVSAAGEGGYARALTDDERALQQSRLAEHLRQVDVIVTTAAIPGRPAPKIITDAMVAGMRRGSVIVDLAAETGGNCSLTEPGRDIDCNGVLVSGPLNLASQGALHASEMFARNVFNFLSLMIAENGALHIPFEDELVAKTCLSTDGRVPDQGA
jgi:H+-translocating NAD(P) transhydrogenase subunit alpha